MSDLLKEAAECREKAAEYQEKARVAPTEHRELHLFLRQQFLDFAVALDQEAKLRAYGSGTRHEI